MKKGHFAARRQTNNFDIDYTLMVSIIALFTHWGRLDSIPTSGQSYKASTIVIYDSRVVPDWKIPHITTLES